MSALKYISAQVCLRPSMSVCKYVSTQVCQHARISASIYICMKACLHACSSACKYITTQVCLHAHTHSHTHTHTHVTATTDVLLLHVWGDDITACQGISIMPDEEQVAKPLGEGIALSCTATGNPKPTTLRWFDIYDNEISESEDRQPSMPR